MTVGTNVKCFARVIIKQKCFSPPIFNLNQKKKTDVYRLLTNLNAPVLSKKTRQPKNLMMDNPAVAHNKASKYCCVRLSEGYAAYE
jgi:hypothetical protein